MIESVFAAEFDNSVGACLVGAFPPKCSDVVDRLLADYMIPDGMHSSERESYMFRGLVALDAQKVDLEIARFNQKSVQANLYLLRNNQKVMLEGVQLSESAPFGFVIDIMERKFLRFAYSSKGSLRYKNFLFRHEHMDVRQLSDRLYTLRAEDDSLYMIEFREKEDAAAVGGFLKLLSENLFYKKVLNVLDESTILQSGWFYTSCLNKKDTTVDRGSIYRAISIFSSKIHLFELMKQPLAACMEYFCGLPPKKDWQAEDHKNLEKRMGALVELCNALVAPEEQPALAIDPSRMVNPLQTVEIQVRQGLAFQKAAVSPAIYNAHAKLLVDALGVNVMVLYRAILSEQKIVFLGEKQKIEKICSLVSATLCLVSPLNIVTKVFPFEHVQSLDVLPHIKGFIAGFTNPIVRSRKALDWGILVDLSNGTIYEPSLRAASVQNDNDRAFIEIVIKKIKEDCLESADVDRMFFDYTRANIELVLNRSNTIRLDSEDEATLQTIFRISDAFKATKFFDILDMNLKNEREEFQSVYSRKYLVVYQAFKFLTEQEKCEDMDLLVCLDSLNSNLVDGYKIDFFLKKVLERAGSLDCMSIGLISDDPNVRLMNKRLIDLLEGSRLWREYSSADTLFHTLLIAQSG